MAGTLASRNALNNFQDAKRFHFSAESGISLAFRKHLQLRDELIKGQYVAYNVIYLDQHLGKY